MCALLKNNIEKHRNMKLPGASTGILYIIAIMPKRIFLVLQI
jgi:hypothetical protein